jgi:GTPase
VKRALPLVALVGRPNVGKSTLFNRLVGARLAIVADVPGTTRDRLYAAAEWAGRSFSVVDTGGLDMGSESEITVRVRNQALLAIDEADVVVLVADGIQGVTPEDQVLGDVLRRGRTPVVVAVNKAERQTSRLDAAEFWALGLGEPWAISALHGTGVGDLLDAVVAALPPATEATVPDGALRVAVVGRPNVGKSSLVNQLLGHERAIVSAEPGTTRDAIDERVVYADREYVLVDTAGIRRRGRVEPGIEKYAVLRATRAIERADVAALLLDATTGPTAQDAHIGGAVREAGCGAIIVINKWDLIEKDTNTERDFARRVRAEFRFLDYAPIVTVSARTGQRAVRVLAMAAEIQACRELRVPTSELNRLLIDMQARHDARRKGRELKLRYATQVAVNPPTFLFFVNDRRLVHFSFERYLENRLRERYTFHGTPLRLLFRDGSSASRP